MFERLTHRDSKGDVWIKDAAHVDEQGQICMLSERLAQYEDIGLTPDEITDMIYRFEAFLCEMTGGRMSKSNYTLDAMISAANEYQQSLCDECWDRSELAKYYELEHEGRLVVLPVKVGDTVYEANKHRNIISTYKVTNVVIMAGTRNYGWELIEGIYSNINGFNEYAFGRSVFLTREEAEKALEAKRRGGKKDE